MDTARPVIRRREEYDHNNQFLAKWWLVYHRGKEYGPYSSYDDAERTSRELAE